MSTASEISWLSRRDKDLPLPSLVFAAMGDWFQRAQGGYYPPDYTPPSDWATAWPDWAANKQLYFNGREYSYANGLILIDTENVFDVEATLAHEWRHHWQSYNQPVKHVHKINRQLDYRSAIVGFFQKNPHEADALRYELRWAPTESNQEWGSYLGWNTRQRIYG